MKTQKAPPTKARDSKDLAEQLGISHHDLMEFYWKLENHVVSHRDLHRATITIVEGSPNGRANYLQNMSPSLILLVIVRFVPHRISSFEHLLGPWGDRVRDCPTCGKPAHDFAVEEAMDCVPPRGVLQFGEHIIDKDYREALYKYNPRYTSEEVVGSFLGHNPHFDSQDAWLMNKGDE